MHTLTRRHFAALCTAALAPSITKAQEKKRDLARLLVPFPPGGTTDHMARLLAEQFRGDVADTVIVDNRPGAAGRIAVQGVRQAPADGATLLLHALSVQSLYPHTFKQLGYDPFADLVPVSTTCMLEFCFAVGPSVPASVKTLSDYAAWVRQDPTRGSYATPGAGNALHFMPLVWGRAEKLDLNPVHYRGTSAAVPDIMGGQIPASSTPLNDALQHGQNGKIRVLATSGSKRNKFTPQVATFAEQGYPQLTYRDFYAVFVHGKTPATTIERLTGSVRKALGSPAVAAGFNTLYLEPAASSAAEALQLARADFDVWSRVVRDVGYQPE